VNEEGKRKLGIVMVDEIGRIMQERKARGRAEAEASALLHLCRRDGHARNPDGKCVRCYDAAEDLNESF
jgi:hypothetical protein